MAKKQQNCLPERAGMCSVVNSSMKFDNKSIWNNLKISVPEICKILVSGSFNELRQYDMKAGNFKSFILAEK